jgi:peptidoglycan DL-endopeptidase CwlO
MTLVAVLSGTVVLATRPASGDSIASARAQAAAIEAKLSAAQNEMSALGQQYDAASARLHQIDGSIASTKATIGSDERQVASDRGRLSKAAIANYVSDGTASGANSIFSGNEETNGAATEYNEIADGNINLAMDNLHTAESTLTAQESSLQSQQGQAQQAVTAEQNAVQQNAVEVRDQKNALAQENGQIAVLITQQQQQQMQAEAAQTAARIRAAQQEATFTAQSTDNQPAPPPTASGGEGAVQAAESQIGVPYVWGAESPKGSPDPGFDCSGLTAWSWAQVGVGLPHYSGAQMSDSTPVPLDDLQPGDLLFYGPGGSEHVAMYVSAGTMIEAPETGQVVHLTALRLGGDFVGAGRP